MVQQPIKNMTTEELLAPRYKVIADYPDCNFDVGAIFRDEDFYIGPKQVRHCFSDYPHLFKLLEWYEERDIKDMPEYVKFNDERNSILSYGKDEEPEIHKVIRHWATSLDTNLRYSNSDNFISEWNNVNYHYGQFLPATEQEYLTYQSTLK
jgi:hypothetical protein